MVIEVMRRLENASIEAFTATESTVGDLYLGGLPSVSIWVKDAVKVRDARAILREVQAQQTGKSIIAKSEDRQCPQCGETVPHDFEICWNCGADC